MRLFASLDAPSGAASLSGADRDMLPTFSWPTRLW